MNRTRHTPPATSWALITGAAGGIGLSFAEALAGRGFGLVLVDIAADRLSHAADSLRATFDITVHTLAIDLSLPAAAAELHRFCTSVGVSPLVVVNNAGVFSFCDVVRSDPASLERMLSLHVVTMSQICRLFAADMVSRPPVACPPPEGSFPSPSAHAAREARGYILNVSSFSAWMPWPGIAAYSASKAFVRSFSLALAAELHPSDVFVTVVLPAGVTTDLYGLSPRLQSLGRRLGILLTPQQIASRALSALFSRRRSLIPGTLFHLLLPLVRCLPSSLVRFIRRKTLKYQK